jgi:hypothetical protein
MGGGSVVETTVGIREFMQRADQGAWQLAAVTVALQAPPDSALGVAARSVLCPPSIAQ